MKKPAVFIDRDGTINEQRGYINHISRFKIIPGVEDAIRLLNQNNFLAIVVSNQSGVARGFYPIELVHEVHALMKQLLEQNGSFLDAIFFCPHHPDGVIPEYTRKCDCRKPGTGLIDQACKSFDIDLSNSYVVGDLYSDMELAERAGVRGILVKTGYGLGEIEYTLPTKPRKPLYVAENLLDAVNWILDEARST
ncbi:MAG: HAD family hydrolase [Deltaproteobacteria bacterium]|nr:HAD family hydrolase [Deltaproteobacteria bacterium]MBW1919574.1 HAD family hydrolase [Deltaproteobacteria bacterium]MBW1931520.1 HAD family hydrolase [Deltaproteobacteria bacterium]MBW1978096.1 HAD family hydrolase [Deltaproteobacteria bacterium]MBW2044837.1 HAD family hydrolase [Deltaproteobacteria bacterium]